MEIHDRIRNEKYANKAVGNAIIFSISRPVGSGGAGGASAPPIIC